MVPMYRVLYGVLYLLSLLPMWLLYLIADLCFLIIYYVIGYRKEVVANNLRIAFPAKTDAERKAIERRFYRNFTDSFLETIKAFSASEAFIKKRFSGDYGPVKAMYDKGYQKVQLHSGHNFNWEYASLSLPLYSPFPPLVVYMPITNKTLDTIFLKMRSRTGANMLSAVHIRNEILPFRNQRYALALVADQNPVNPAHAYWVDFFGRPTPFLKAPESGARRGNVPVLFCYFKRERRGHYSIFYQLAEEQPASTQPGELTKQYAKFLQAAIEQQPDNWLWSHRRWKWEWKPEYGKKVE